MRFRRLQIPAFGPFTELDLSFPSAPADLHLIYGANEAGKSSLLRAIRDLLFGIHAQSTDDFLHPYGALRIKGEIENREGKQLAFQRRKGNKNTVLDASDHPLPDSALAAFLGTVDQSYFSAMFGLGARELREGAQQLLQGDGDIGAALFSASMGGAPVQKVVESLQQESEKLYKGRATANVAIRPGASRFKELLKQSREAAVSPEKWDDLERQLTAAETRKHDLDCEVSKLELQIEWLSRCEDSLPTVNQLKEAERNLMQLPPLPELASDFPPRVQHARASLHNAKAEVSRCEAAAAKSKNSCALVPPLRPSWRGRFP